MAEFARLLAFCFVAVLASGIAPLKSDDEGGRGPSDPVPATAKQPKIEPLGGDNFRLGNLQFNQKTKKITLAGKVNMRTGYLEYAIVNELTGKTHESLLTSTATPLELNVALLLLGYKPSDSVAKQEEDLALTPELNSSFDVQLRWSVKGKKRETPLETWIQNLATDSTAELGPWLYTGSKFEGERFAAETDGSILAIYRDPRSLANNPREGKFSDEIWRPAAAVPPKDTSVEIVLSPHPAKKAE